jgi:hypothetical protein
VAAVPAQSRRRGRKSVLSQEQATTRRRAAATVIITSLSANFITRRAEEGRPAQRFFRFDSDGASSFKQKTSKHFFFRGVIDRL